MDIRLATADDAAMLACIHVQSWAEAYADLLPPEEHAARGQMYRYRLWSRVLAEPDAHVALAPDIGFAQIGSQRDKALAAKGYSAELYCLYVLAKAHGTGVARALVNLAHGDDPQPFSTCVLDNNPRACGFYKKIGGRLVDVRDEVMGQTPIRERVYVWDEPVSLGD